MLSGIFGKKSDHPMADIKSAQALLEDLPKNDAFKSVMELSEWVESVAGATDFKLEHQFAVLRLLDETAQPHLRKLTRDYFTSQELNKFQENRLWLLLDNYYHHAAQAYCAVLNRYCSSDKVSVAVKAQLPMLAARAVAALAGWMKYVCARYGPVGNAIWEALAQVYRQAEQQQCLDVPLTLYPSAAGTTTVNSEIGRLLSWYGCGVNTLKPLYMHLTERILAQHSSTIGFGVQCGTSGLFGFDLEHPAAPQLLRANTAAHPFMRFVCMTEMQTKLAELVRKLEKGIVPEDLNLGGNYDAETVCEAAQYLLNFLSAPPSRRSARRGIKVGMEVVSGFESVIGHTDLALDFSEEQPAHWDVEDISATGFRTILPGQGGGDVRIGSLLGVKPEGVPHWGAAVVRRLMRDNENRLHVGAEMLTNQISGVALSQSGGGGGFEEEEPALWLQTKPEQSSGEAQLLMRAGAFSAHRSLQARLGGKRFLLIPGKLQEKGIDYDLVKFRAIEQEAGPG